MEPRRERRARGGLRTGGRVRRGNRRAATRRRGVRGARRELAANFNRVWIDLSFCRPVGFDDLAHFRRAQKGEGTTAAEGRELSITCKQSQGLRHFDARCPWKHCTLE